MSDYYYTIYGLKIRSELELPELVSISSSMPDVVIKVGVVSETLKDSRQVARRWQSSPNAFQFTMDGVARYRCQDNRDITVDPCPSCDLRRLRIYLISSVLSALLHLLKRLPLHASAIDLDGQAVLFCGHSGAGKSTLAALLQRMGYPLFSDDVVATGNGPKGWKLVYPGSPRLKLWSETLNHFNIESDSLIEHTSRGSKFHLQFHESIGSSPRPLHAIFFLSRSREIGSAKILKLDPLEGLRNLINYTYRHKLMVKIGDPKRHFNQCAQIAAAIPMFQYARPWNLDCLEDSLGVLFEKLRKDGGLC